MICGIILILCLLLALQYPIDANQTYNFMNAEEMLHLKEIYKQIDKLEQLNNKHSAACTLGSDNYLNVLISGASDMIAIYDTMDWISTHYEDMRRFERGRFENDTQVNMAKVQLMTSHGENHQAVEEVYLKLFGKDDLIGQLARDNQKYHIYTCKTPQSPQQFLYTFYVDYVIFELKAHALVEWAWMLLRKFGLGGSIEEENESRKAYKRRTSGTLSKIKKLMSQADRSVWRCDPRYHKLGVTYEEVTRLLQGYIENEVDLNSDETCRHDCGYYTSAKNEGCFDNKFCARQPKCSGGVHDCRFVESDMEICQAGENSNRRYEFIQYKSGHLHGRKGSCGTWLNRAKSWNRWIFIRCSYCVCLCDDQSPKSDRYFNLRPVIADVDNNRVVTGLRFVKINRIFHLQIQEGELLPLGVINETTIQWKPVDAYTITDNDVKESVDFHMLTYEKRSIDLGELKVENNSVVTGLRFQVVGTHLQMQAQFSRVNFESGKLIEPTITSFWISGAENQQRESLPLKGVDLPTESFFPSTPYPSDNQFIEFTNTGFEQDAAQTTVPYIDIQDVVSDPVVPLSGIGIYYKGEDGYGGFLGPKIITYDFTPYVQLPSWEIMNSKKLD
nr:uncharacterized protein LOC108065941 isoform X1 [Drosophila takahashii]